MKLAAFGTQVLMGNGRRQIETATVTGTITTAGDALVTVTAAGLTGSPKDYVVPVALGDTAAAVAHKIGAKLQQDAALAALFFVFVYGAKVQLTGRGTTQDTTLNLAIDNDTCAGLTAAPISVNTAAGGGIETFLSLAQLKTIGGPSLALDTEDVTTHDSAGAWEEAVGTVLRSGELSLDVVYDPQEDSFVAFLMRLANRILDHYQLLFPNGVTWTFDAIPTGLEPSADASGALTGTLKLKLTDQPGL